MNVAFLLGAGISRGVLPLSSELDALIQSARASDGRMVVRRSDGQYNLVLPGTIPPQLDSWTPRVRRFLDWLVKWLGKEDHDYEALYFACQQVNDELSNEYENALLRPFIQECASHVGAWWGPDPPEDGANPRPAVNKVHDLTREARNYIAGAVAGALTHAPEVCAQLARTHRPLLDACRDDTLGFVDVVTLNHDTLLETSFKVAGLSVEDGFRSGRGVDRWVGYRVENAPRLRFVKLHGSIDWWEMKRLDSTGKRRPSRSSGYPFRVKDGLRQDLHTGFRPRTLIGTANKMLEYLKPFNLDRLAVFRRSLIRCRGLVVAGYSFRDKGVNDLLIDWCWNRNRRLIVIDPSLDGTAPTHTARPAVKRSWDKLVTRHRLLPIAKRFDAVEWSDVRSFFRDTSMA